MTVKSLLEVLYGRVAFPFDTGKILLPNRWLENEKFMSEHGDKQVKGIHILSG